MLEASSSVSSRDATANKWEAVIILPEDAVVKSVDLTCIQNAKLSKTSAGSSGNGKRSVLPSGRDFL